ncbi:hypothetical protein BKA65DRAFT_177305 [Rhexocercosporidium sp. MPI-PUGE-AT-0058]|nr:hypothetical protein BKA65DRAFT_177305 [Rhexocercosporidium sp. MPI-PUGE-AT-0058]
MDSAIYVPGDQTKSLEPAQPSQETTRQTKEPARYPCADPLCSKRFTRRGALNEHTRRSHTNERQFICRRQDGCSKAFATLRDRARHELIHDEQKQFVCQGMISISIFDQSWGCGKAFAREDGLVAHLKATGGKCYKNVSQNLIAVVRWNTLGFYKVRDLPGTWTCRYRNPSVKPSKKTSWEGCGTKFKTRDELMMHVDGDVDGSCSKQYVSTVAIDCKQKAEDFVCQNLKSQRQSGRRATKKRIQDEEEMMSTKKVTTVFYKVIYSWSNVEILLRVPHEHEGWEPSNMDFEYGKEPKFTCERLMENDQSSCTMAYTYRLQFSMPDRDPGVIKLKGNFTGDFNSYTYGSIGIKTILGNSLYTPVDCVYETFHCANDI